MSLNVKIVKTYAKSLFQNLTNTKAKMKKDGAFTPATITSSDANVFAPDIFIIGEELLLIRAILVSSSKLKLFFKNPTYPEQEKLDIILAIFPGLTVTMKSFLKVLAERRHLSFIPAISDEYNGLILKFKNATKVKIIVASPLAKTMGPLLLKSLQSLTASTEVILSVGYDPKLLGGVVLEYNSVAVDASILKEFSLFFSEV